VPKLGANILHPLLCLHIAGTFPLNRKVAHPHDDCQRCCLLPLQGELMVATNLFAVYGKPATMSRITLAFMQDTGWYDVNWDNAGERRHLARNPCACNPVAIYAVQRQQRSGSSRRV
jgi:hypothetical protein